jgi:FlaA1/EpsC-like NDP-sugar epimerase
MLSFYFFGLYRRMWRYATITDLLSITYAVTFGSFLIISYFQILNLNWPSIIYFISWFLCVAFIGASRLAIRVWHYYKYPRKNNSSYENVLIIGAGDAGAIIARELQQRYYATKKLVGFIDDAPEKRKQMMFGCKVLGTCADIKEVVTAENVREIIIAMPSVKGSIIKNIVRNCKSTDCKVKIAPGLYELIDGKVSIQQLRDVDVTDLLRRAPVRLNLKEISGYLTGKCVLVTGAGGSIGSELCRQIARLSPQKLILVGKGENSIYDIDLELRETFPNLIIEPVIADVRDRKRISSVFKNFRPNVVFHAAAHKHVPLMEYQPEEAVRNNIFGTKIVAETADKFNVDIFVMISTDKAVNPANVMGATKRIAELVIQDINKNSNTKFVAVRFGNVLGSRGSVIPLFKRQIARGGPLTITHPDIQRYFMTIPEATQLVLQAASLAKGGEVFVLDMGEPIKIVDMAYELIELSGLVPEQDIKINFVGLRPGEKIFEELLTAEEGTCATKHEQIFVANITPLEKILLKDFLLALDQEKDGRVLVSIMEKLLPTYKEMKRQQAVIANKLVDIKSHSRSNVQKYVLAEGATSTLK